VEKPADNQALNSSGHKEALSRTIRSSYIRYNPRQQPCSKESADTKS